MAPNDSRPCSIRIASPITVPSSTAPSTRGKSSVARISRMPMAMVARPRAPRMVSRKRSGNRVPATAPMALPAMIAPTLVRVPIMVR